MLSSTDASYLREYGRMVDWFSWEKTHVRTTVTESSAEAFLPVNPRYKTGPVPPYLDAPVKQGEEKSRGGWRMRYRVSACMSRWPSDWVNDNKCWSQRRNDGRCRLQADHVDDGEGSSGTAHISACSCAWMRMYLSVSMLYSFSAWCASLLTR